MLIDLDVHAGAHGLSLDDTVQRAIEAGLDGVAILGDDALPDVALLRGHDRLRLFAGAEVATDRGHYLVFFPNPAEVAPLSELFGKQGDACPAVRDVIARVNALGGAIIAARPYDRTIEHPGGDILYTLTGLAAIEVVAPLHPKEIAWPAIEAAECLGLPCVGGSGARGSAADVGSAATLFTQTIRDEAELVDALRAGACWPVEFGEPPAQVPRRDNSHSPANGHGNGDRRRR